MLCKDLSPACQAGNGVSGLSGLLSPTCYFNPFAVPLDTYNSFTFYFYVYSDLGFPSSEVNVSSNYAVSPGVYGLSSRDFTNTITCLDSNNVLVTCSCKYTNPRSGSYFSALPSIN